MTHDNKQYFQTVIDDYSQFVVVYLLNSKSEAENNLKKYISELETQHEVRVKKIRVDNGGEFVSNEFKTYARQKGIIVQYTAPYSPQQNGKSERMNRTLLNKIRTKLIDSCVPKDLWGEALRSSAYELNRSPTSTLKPDQTPALLWYGKQDISKIRIFGSKVWCTQLPKGSKLEPRAKCGVMIGYCGSGYRVWIPKEHKVISSRDVVFDESKMYFAKTENQVILPTNEEEDESKEENYENEKPESKEEEDEPVKLKRICKKPSHLNDYELYSAYCLLTKNQEPETYEEAIQDEEWQKAIDSELASHKTLGTWKPSTLPPNQKAINLKWIFRIKEDGTKKARLVAKGFQQPFSNEELNYSPVCRMTTFRILLTFALIKEWKIKQIDVPTAFLNGTLQEDVYIKRPKGVKEDQKVYKLHRSLYGLRSSPKCWNDKFSEVIQQLGLKRSEHDYCLYYAQDIYLLLFVDDCLITGDSEKVENLISELYENFKVKLLGDASCFLGMEIIKNNNGLQVKQTRIIERLLNEFKMESCRQIATPMEVGFQIDENEEIIDVPYRKLVCSLMYLAVTTRPDLAYAVSVLSRVLDTPTNQTWKAAKRVLRYLSSTKHLGLKFSKGGSDLMYENKLIGYADADWGGDVTSRKSTSGFVALYNQNPVAWFSKKQTCVALSTMEAEYLSASSATQELVNLRGIVSEFEKSNTEPIILKVDNNSAISMVKTFQNSKRGKHIDIRAHFIKDLYMKKVIDVQYVSSNENLADLFTKPLCKDKFSYLRSVVLKT